jgi:hypothetical protein
VVLDGVLEAAAEGAWVGARDGDRVTAGVGWRVGEGTTLGLGGGGGGGEGDGEGDGEPVARMTRLALWVCAPCTVQ